MDKTTIYRKTGQGAEAIATRHGALGPRLRSLLILVDGRRTHQELATLGAAWGDPEELLGGLLSQGLIEPVAQAAAAPVAAQHAAPPAAAPAPAAADGGKTVPLAQAQRHAVRRLTDLMGPSAESLCMRLESTRSAEEFRAALARAEGIVREVAGPKRAAQFMEEMESYRPA